jgi:hypothetical protein
MRDPLDAGQGLAARVDFRRESLSARMQHQVPELGDLNDHRPLLPHATRFGRVGGVRRRSCGPSGVAGRGLSVEHTGRVLVTLAGAVVRDGRMPHRDPTPAEIYVALLDDLCPTGRIGEVRGLPV